MQTAGNQRFAIPCPKGSGAQTLHSLQLRRRKGHGSFFWSALSFRRVAEHLSFASPVLLHSEHRKGSATLRKDFLWLRYPTELRIAKPFLFSESRRTGLAKLRCVTLQLRRRKAYCTQSSVGGKAQERQVGRLGLQS